MKRRRRAGKGDRKRFSRTASKTHRKNLPQKFMRGGIRL